MVGHAWRGMNWPLCRDNLGEANQGDKASALEDAGHHDSAQFMDHSHCGMPHPSRMGIRSLFVLSHGPFSRALREVSQ
jgi:hypothetical protein